MTAPGPTEPAPEDSAPSPGPTAPSRRAVLAAAAASAALAACSAPAREAGAAATTGPTTARPSPTPPSTGPSGPAPSGSGPSAPDPSPKRPVRPSVLETSGPDIVHGPRSRQEVALTFHGQGPAALTEQALAHCREAGATITVFAVGTWLADAPSLGRAIVHQGHDLGNHTWSHQQMPLLDAPTAKREVARGASALARAVGSAGWWFRPSGTPRSTATIRAAALASGYRRCVSYDVDPEDYRDPGAALVRSRTRRQVRPGSIVSLHLGHPGTVDALPGILSDLSSSGLRPVTLSVLLRD